MSCDCSHNEPDGQDPVDPLTPPGGDARMRSEAAPPDSALEKVARGIFGASGSAVRRWVDYWGKSVGRNRRLLSDFEKVILLETEGRRVLDIGCGTGGLAEALAGRASRYFGLDYHRHVLQFTRPAGDRAFVQGSGIQLPFADRSFDLIFAFDVVEHLTGGLSWQTSFLCEAARVLAPQGLILLTTPNFWYPYDAHSDLYCPQFLPSLVRDRYIRRRRPGFLQEHATFGNIRLMRPGALRKALRTAAMTPLHELPCCMDRKQYVQAHPVRGLLSYLGLGWHTHAEFWMILSARPDRDRLRRRLRQSWDYEHAQPAGQAPSAFEPVIDFDHSPCGHQLGSGWFWHETADRGYRWTGRQAVCYLDSRPRARYLTVEGFSPWDKVIDFLVEGERVGQAHVAAQRIFQRRYLIPLEDTARKLLEIEVRCRTTNRPGTKDERDLGVMIFRVGLQE